MAPTGPLRPCETVFKAGGLDPYCLLVHLDRELHFDANEDRVHQNRHGLANEYLKAFSREANKRSKKGECTR